MSLFCLSQQQQKKKIEGNVLIKYFYFLVPENFFDFLIVEHPGYADSLLRKKYLIRDKEYFNMHSIVYKGLKTKIYWYKK